MPTNRVRVRDADKAIFRPNTQVQGEEVNRDFGKPPVRQVTCYTVFGKHDYLDGDDYPILGDLSEDELAESRPLAFAKVVRVDHRNPKYYVKRASNGRFFNPFGQDEGRHNKQLHHTGRKEFEYHEVNERAFSFYVDFLRTKNSAHLRNAERETF